MIAEKGADMILADAQAASTELAQPARDAPSSNQSRAFVWSRFVRLPIRL